MSGSGIYKIQSICKPERAYIGSALNFSNRWRQHLHLLRKGTHHSIKLQRHYDKYGESDLMFRIIEPCLPQFLIVIENTYLHPIKPYFNVCSEAGSILGFKCSKETKQKQRDAKLKNPTRYWLGKKRGSPSEKTLEKMRTNGNKPPSRKGTHHTEETIQTMRDTRKGKNYLKGTHHSEEHRKNQSESMVGKNTWMTGTHPSEATLKKKSDSMKIVWLNKKLNKAS